MEEEACMKLWMFLNGKKTYIVAALILVKGALMFFTGEANMLEAVDYVFASFGISTLRLGISGAVKTKE